MYKLSRIMLILAVLATAYCLALFVAQFGGLVCIGIVFVVLAAFAKRGYGALTAHGTARWAHADDLRKAGMLDAKSGLIIGRVADDGKLPLSKALRGLFNPGVSSKEACEEFLKAIQIGRKATINPALVRIPKAVHTAVFAPVGAGKSTGVVIGFLQNCSDSCVVVDFKGELASITANHRRDVFGHKIRILDPFRIVTQTPDRMNVLDGIDRDSPFAVDDARDLAAAIVVRTGEERETHFNDSAEAFIAAKIALVAAYGEPNDRSLQTVRTLLNNPQKMQMAIELMCKSNAFEGMLSRMGHGLTRYVDRELGSTLTTTNRHLRFLDTIAIAENTSGSSFDPAELRDGKTTVYLVLPPEHFRAQSGLLRLWIGSLLRAVIRGGLQETNNVHFVLDEAASLGHLEPLDDAVDKYRGYGVRLQFYYQSLGQLKKCWPAGQDQTLLSNVTQVFFGTNDLPTAEYVSNRLGEETIVIASGGTSTGTSRQTSSRGEGSFSTSSNRNDNWAMQGRKLLKPEEVMALSNRTAITFTPGVPPIWTTLVRYFEEPNLGQGPGRWERFKATANVVTGSLLLMLATWILAMAFSVESHGRGATKQSPVNNQQQYFVPNER